MASKVAPLPSPTSPWIGPDGRPLEGFQKFMTLFAALNVGSLASATDDVAAAKAGVAVGQMYQSAGAVRIRLS